MPRRLSLFLLPLTLVATCRAGDASDILARAKAASGGARWDALTSWRAEGSASIGGLHGRVQVVVDARDGRSSDTYAIGPVQGADGFDGSHAWQRDAGGEVAVLDAPAALRRARSEAWLNAHGYWFAKAHPAHWGAVRSAMLDGKRYAVVVATPAGGDPLHLWFAADSGLLARVQAPQGARTRTTVYADYRRVDGLYMPFHVTVDVTDAAGRTDPRDRSEVALTKVTLDGAVGTADFAVPTMAPTARIDNARGITTIPFDKVNNHIYVDGRIDGKPVRLLVDTGGVNLLTPAAAKRLGMHPEGKLAGGGVGDARVDLALAHARQLRLGEAVLAKPVFYVIDLGDLPAVEGVPADGLVGYEMFRRFGVEIDYARQRLILSEPARFTPPAGAAAIAFQLDEHIPIVTGNLDGIPIRLSIDTGSRTSLTLHAPFAHAHHLVERYHAASAAVMGWGVGGASRGHPARFGVLTIGSVRIDGIAGDIYTGDKGAFADPDLGGNLGGGVLRRFDVAFDYANKTMYLKPNADAGTPDAFDRSGLWLLADGDALKVVDVAAGSAAQRADLRDGDRILAIGGEPIGAHSLAQWRARLRTMPAGTRLALRVLRDGKPGDATLVLADRIPAAFTD